MDMHLLGKNAIVTGGSRGLGEAICEELAREGANIIVNYAASANKAEAVCRRISDAYGVQAAAIQADVSKEADVIRLFEGCESNLGRADILVNNAGICPVRMIVDTDFSEWQQVMQVNVDSVFLTSREFCRRAIAGGAGGRIVNVISQAAYNGSKRGKTPYSASKGAVLSFTISLSKEVAQYGIYVNAVAPGMMLTDLTRETLSIPDEMEKYHAAIPVGRLGTLSEVARMVAFYASDAASYTTGAVVDVTGGIMSR